MKQLALSVLLLLSSCQPGARLTDKPVPLNSERIEAKFGSYGIEVLEHDPVRVSNLFSTHDGTRICRTFAVVDFYRDPPDELAPAKRKILGGASLGATLKESGWKISKQHLYLGKIPPGARFRSLAQLPEEDWNGKLAIAIYQLNVEKDGVESPFATIAEVHHPEYLTLNDLKKLAAISSNQDPDMVRRVELLKRLAADEMAEGDAR